VQRAILESEAGYAEFGTQKLAIKASDRLDKELKRRA
jgi:hypothetical protein